MIGSVLENYRILSKLGGGGMGEVYVAEHTGLGKQVAIKILRPEYAANPEILQRFYNEARAVTLIGHEAIADVEHFGKQPNGAPFFAMELLRGEALGARLRREGRLSAELAVFLGWLLTEPLEAAHQRGIIHRDLKPDNVFLVPERLSPVGLKLKVLDFGIAKLIQEDAGVATMPHSMVGTPAYMSPEQCRGSGQVDRRSDIYALGCILYEMVTGRPPFVAVGKGELISAHMNLTPARPRTIEPSVPTALDAIIVRMLEKNPDKRFQSMYEVGVALEMLCKAGPARTWPEAVGPSLGIETPAPGATLPPIGESVSTMAPTSLASLSPRVTTVPKLKARWVGIVAASGLALLFGALWWNNLRMKPLPAQLPSSRALLTASAPAANTKFIAVSQPAVSAKEVAPSPRTASPNLSEPRVKARKPKPPEPKPLDPDRILSP